MNVNTVFTPRAPFRLEHVTRSDVAPRIDDQNESTGVQEQRAPTRTEFSALMALLAGAGTTVRVDLLRQVPAEGVSLLDKMLDGSALDADATGDSAVSASTSDSALLASSQRAVDHLRYGIVKEDPGVSDESADRDALTLALGGASGPSRPRIGDDHAHLNEVIGRIVSRRGTSVDQLKARGDNEAADVRAALDALLAQAGTPVGLELAGAVDPAAVRAAAALANAKVVSAADNSTPVRDVDALAPELRHKLARVIERMKGEYGHDVSVVETARSQERQDFLYEQGRSRAGAVVTWTRDSAHTRGDAVDVIVDGKWSNADGFARLQRIAKEEGLRTLGIRDPGHLELESPGRPIEGATISSASTRREAMVAPGIATAASQPGVARVAGLAGVASIARVADGGRSRGIDRSSAPDTGMSEATGTIPSAIGPAGERGQGNAFGRGERETDGRPLNDGHTFGGARRETFDVTQPNAFGAIHTNTSIANTQSTDGAAAAPGVDSASRVADVQQVRDSAPAGSVSRMTLHIDTADGGQDRITVDLRGTAVGTQIRTDVENAERLRLRTAELQDALGRHGLESDSVRISGAARNELNDAARIVSSERDGLRLSTAQHGAANDSATNQGQRDRTANAREWDRPESSRQSRDEQRESARQGAGQRGQRGTPNGSA